MLWFALGLVMAQGPACTGAGADLMAEGARLASMLALEDAADRYADAAASGCQTGGVARAYLSGLVAARDAYALGGSRESLQPVRQAEAALEALAGRGEPVAEIARVLLMAAAAAAQSERDQMATLLIHATQLERRRVDAGQDPVPAIPAHELAGDLWLQVHRFEDARAAYQRAEDLFGRTPRTALGLARTAERLQDTEGACAAYASLVRLWRGSVDHPGIEQARTYRGRYCGIDASPVVPPER